MSINDLSYTVRGAIFRVYKNLGPGLLESAYEAALHYELTQESLIVERQVQLPLIYNGVELETGYRIDMIVDKRLIIEIKAMEILQRFITNKFSLT